MTRTKKRTPAAASASAASDVLPGQVAFPDRAADADGFVRVPAGDFRLMRAAALVQVAASAKRARESKLAAAVAEGRISQDRVGEWRHAYNLNPLAAIKQMETLPVAAAAATPTAAAGTSSEEQVADPPPRVLAQEGGR